jgi:hypothetical protein
MGLSAVNPVVWVVIVGLFAAALPRRLWVQRRRRARDAGRRQG